MKVAPIAGPMGVQPVTSNNTDARARAMSILSGGNTQAPPINQNSISPEDSGIVRQSAVNEETEVVEQVAEEQAQTLEQAVEETKPKADDTSEQYQKLLRREKALRAQQRQQEETFKKREQELKAREEALNSNKTDLSKYVDKDSLSADPLGTLVSLGYDAQQIAELLIQQQQPQDPRVTAEMRALKAEIKRLSEASEKASKAQEEQQTQAYTQAVKQIETDVKKMVFTDPAYEMIKHTNSHKDVVELIERTWKEDGYLMSNEEAAEQVENYLIEEALKLANANKVKSRLAPKVAQPSAKAAPQQTQATTPKQPQPMKTLTNAASSSRKLTAKERAILAFKGELK